MTKLKKLLYVPVLTNGEYDTFMKLFLTILNKFTQKITPEDKPDSIDDSGLTPYQLLIVSKTQLEKDYEELEKVIRIPTKLTESEDVKKFQLIMANDFGYIKKLINNLYANNKNDEKIRVLWNLIRIYKNLSKHTANELQSTIAAFINATRKEEYKLSFESIKIADLVTNLDEKNQKFRDLIILRNDKRKNIVRNQRPARVNCYKSYENVYNILNSIIILENEYDILAEVNEFNGLYESYNDITRRKKLKKEENNDKPDPLTPNESNNQINE